MKAVFIDSFAKEGNIKVGDLPIPKPEDDEVCIAVEYAGINPVDGKIAEGLLQSRLPHQFPIILGWEAAGKIHSMGKNVKTFSVGDRVYAYCRKPIVQHGCFAEFITLKARHVAQIPESLSTKAAAVIPLAGLTAWQCLFEKAQLKPDETVLIHGGAGGVGGFAIQWAKYSNAVVITTASAENKEYVKHLGADEIIDYKNIDFVKYIKKHHPYGIDVVLDTVGKDVYKKSFEVLKKGGKIVSILEQPNERLASQFEAKALYHFVEPSSHELKEIAKLFERGKVTLPKIKMVEMDQAAEAIYLIKQGHSKGKTVLKIC